MKDSLFIRGEKIPMTKEEIRSVCLSKLDLHDAETLLDVGAGSGSVGIEACIQNDKLKVCAIECKEAACGVILKNKDKFAIENFKLIHAKAPVTLDTQFDRIFIGGSGGRLAEIIRWSREILNVGGITVCSFIVYENAVVAKREMAACGYKNIEFCQIMVNKSEKLGEHEYLKPINPVFILKGEK
jgi:cobalt-precorrin-6B (C15)-methyltransferase